MKCLMLVERDENGLWTCTAVGFFRHGSFELLAEAAKRPLGSIHAVLVESGQWHDYDEQMRSFAQ